MGLTASIFIERDVFLPDVALYSVLSGITMAKQIYGASSIIFVCAVHDMRFKSPVRIRLL